MAFKRYLIAPLNAGLVNNVKPWLTPDDSFTQLDNAVVFRGRVEKRWGTTYIESNTSSLQSRLRIQIDTIVGGVAAGNVPGSTYFIGQQFSVGDTILTSYQAAGALRTTVAGENGTYNTATGAYTFAIAVADGTPIYFYPLMPVMGLTQFDGDDINFETTIAFDQQFSYQYDITTSSFQRLGPTSIWSGGLSNFYWSTMFSNGDNQDLLFTMNNKAFDATKTYDGIKYRADTVLATDWTNYAPAIQDLGGVDRKRIVGARCAIPFKNRLLIFAPFEADDIAGVIGVATQVQNRVRFSWLQDVTDEANAFFEASGKGGYIDAYTTEAIITVQFVKDRIVVYFESSTFELVYTGAPDAPFVWQRLDKTLGAESTFSEVPFDDVVVGIGSNGIHACNGASVVRIDEKIPDTIFQALNEYRDTRESLSSIVGIRDYIKEYVYWLFPEGDTLTNYPNRILVYDYKYKNWAFFDDTYTMMGYHDQIEGFIWGKWIWTWESSNDPWSYAERLQHARRIILGNQQGYILQVQHGRSQLQPALSITSLAPTTITCYQHNFSSGDFVRISGCVGSTNMNDRTVLVDTVAVDGNSFTFIDKDNVEADPGYVGGGQLARVNNVRLRTKQFNFYTDAGQQTYIPYIEFLVDRTALGQHTVDYMIGSSSDSMIYASQASGALLGTNILETSPYQNNIQERFQDRLWHRVYFQANNDVVQLYLYYTDEQMYDNNIPFTDFVLHAMLIYADAQSSRIAD